MNGSCKIIQDLLPLYHDAVCSEESRVLVEEHLEICPDCRQLLEQLKVELDHPVIPADESKPIRTIAKVWKKDKFRSFLKGALITAIICAVLMGTYVGLTQWKIIPVPAEKLEVSEVSRLEDGRIIYHLSVNDNKALHFTKFTTNVDGSYYITPMRSVIERSRREENGLFRDYFMVDVAESNAWQQRFGDGIEITSCYIGPTGDGVLIWEEGMQLPSASSELEKMVLGGN